MENIKKYSNYNESLVEIEDSEEGVYVLTLHDIHNIVNSFTDTEITEDLISEELQDYKFVKIEDPEIEEIEPTEEIEDITGSAADEDPTLIKKYEE